MLFRSGLGMDPLQFRRKNSIGVGDKSPLGEVMKDCLMVETLQAGADAAGWSAPKRKGVGRGISMYDRHVGSGAASVSLKVTWDGGVVLTTTAPDTGTGSHTILAQIVAEALKRPLDEVHIVAGSTDDTREDGGVGGSRVTNVHGNAALKAANEALELLKAGAANMLSQPADQLTYDTDRFTAPNGRWVTWTDAVHGAWKDRKSTRLNSSH